MTQLNKKKEEDEEHTRLVEPTVGYCLATSAGPKNKQLKYTFLSLLLDTPSLYGGTWKM